MNKVRSFQRKHGLREDGILGPNTLDAMNHETKGFTEFNPEDDEPAPEPETPVPENSPEKTNPEPTIPGATTPI